MKKCISLWLIALALISTSCEKEAEPYYVLTIVAHVVDTDGNPIQGIYAYPEGGSFLGREGYSNYKGEIGAFAHLKPRREWVVIFEDVDGDYNGGIFESVRVDISDRVLPATAPDEWGYAGSCSVVLGDVVMSRIE